ncbi:MAG: MBL fold metallo-hydrolase [Nitrospinota bacterium]|nr:MBL fold metallo-hydrolase [Nitrospinota bacterium]
MASALEDELGDIIQKARDGKSWGQTELARRVGLSTADIRRIEHYEWTPDDTAILRIAQVLDLHGPSLLAIARERWVPAPVIADPAPFDLVCLDVFMGLYPVKCYLLICRETRETAVLDTGANPEAIIKKAKELGVIPCMILLTHAHPDHAGGLSLLDRQFNCPTFIDKKEPRPSGSRDLHFVEDGQDLELGKLKIRVMTTPGHTPGGVSYVIGRSVVSGDAIFAGSMGRANASWLGLFNSITCKLLTLPDDFRLHPGHGPATTVGEEKQNNPFFFGKVSSS